MIYIGQALNIRVRAVEHNYRNKYACDKALKKHSATIEILEQVNNIEQLDEIETKWITFYNATNKKVGYNIVKEGNASSKRGTENAWAAFTPETLKEVVYLLQFHPELSYEKIAEKYNVGKGTIYRINKGYSYYDSTINYPIRPRFSQKCQEKNDVEEYFDNLDSLLALKDDLKFRWDLSIEEDLRKIYNLPLRVIRDINLGRKFKDYGNYEYPIRKKNTLTNRNNFSYQDIMNILKDLSEGIMPKIKIADKYNISRNLLDKINSGNSYYIKDYDYPARKK